MNNLLFTFEMYFPVYFLYKWLIFVFLQNEFFVIKIYQTTTKEEEKMRIEFLIEIVVFVSYLHTLFTRSKMIFQYIYVLNWRLDGLYLLENVNIALQFYFQTLLVQKEIYRAYSLWMTLNEFIYSFLWLKLSDF